MPRDNAFAELDEERKRIIEMIAFPLAIILRLGSDYAVAELQPNKPVPLSEIFRGWPRRR